MSDEFIRIEDNKATLYTDNGSGRATPNRTVLLSDLVAKIQSLKVNEATPLLLNITRYYLKRGLAEIIVLEEEPKVREVNWKIKNTVKKVNLAFPFVIYVLMTNSKGIFSTHLFYLNRPLDEASDQLCMHNLPFGSENLYAIPLGDSFNISPAKSVEDKSERVLDRIWRLEFDRNQKDACFAGYAGSDPRISSFDAWVKATAEDPMFVFEINWKNTGLCIQDFVDLTSSDSMSNIQTADELAAVIARIK